MSLFYTLCRAVRGNDGNRSNDEGEHRPSRAARVVGAIAIVLAVGFNVFMVAIYDGVVAHAVPSDAVEELFDVGCASGSPPVGDSCSVPLIRQMPHVSHLVKEVGYYSLTSMRVRTVQSETPSMVALVSSGFFSTLGIWPQEGRWFIAADNYPDKTRAVIVSDELWRKEFGRRHDLIGRTIGLDGTAYAIYGVMPPRFHFPAERNVDIWVLRPLSVEDFVAVAPTGFQVVLRAQRGVTVDRISADLNRGTPEYAQWLNHRRNVVIKVTPLKEHVVGALYDDIIAILVSSFVTLIVVGISVLIVCRVAQPSTVPCSADFTWKPFCKAGLLGGLGVLHAWGAIGSLTATKLSDSSIWRSVAFDIRVGAYGVLVSVAIAFTPYVWRVACTGRARGLALQRAECPHRPAFPNVAFMILVERALVIVLLSAGLNHLLEYRSALLTPLGFEPAHLTTVNLSSTVGSQTATTKIDTVMKTVNGNGAPQMAVASFPPLSLVSVRLPVFVTDASPSRAQSVRANVEAVSASFFSLLNVPIVVGTSFTDRQEERPCGVVVNERFAADLYGTSPAAVGRRISTGGLTGQGTNDCTIIGVSRDIRAASIAEPPMPEVYLHYHQWKDINRALLIRTNRWGRVPEPVLQLVDALHLPRFVTTKEFLSRQTQQQRIAAFSILGPAAACMLLFAMTSWLTPITPRVTIAVFPWRWPTSMCHAIATGAVAAGVVHSLTMMAGHRFASTASVVAAAACMWVLAEITNAVTMGMRSNHMVSQQTEVEQLGGYPIEAKVQQSGEGPI